VELSIRQILISTFTRCGTAYGAYWDACGRGVRKMSGHAAELLSGTGRQGLSHLCDEIAKNIEIASLDPNARIANRICIPRLGGQLSTADLAAKVPIVDSAIIVAQIRPDPARRPRCHGEVFMKKKVAALGFALSVLVLCSSGSSAPFRNPSPPCSGYGCRGFESPKSSQPKSSEDPKSKSNHNGQVSAD
jgi:hypothetical protein